MTQRGKYGRGPIPKCGSSKTSRSTLSAWRGKRLVDMTRAELIRALQELDASYTALARASLGSGELEPINISMDRADELMAEIFDKPVTKPSQ